MVANLALGKFQLNWEGKSKRLSPTPLSDMVLSRSKPSTSASRASIGLLDSDSVSRQMPTGSAT
jgi:hypothetical protein